MGRTLTILMSLALSLMCGLSHPEVYAKSNDAKSNDAKSNGAKSNGAKSNESVSGQSATPRPQPSTSPTTTEQPDGWRFAGLPLLGYNVERGLGAGLYLATFKKRALPPGSRGVSYHFALNSILLWTVKGYQNHRLIFDVPYLNDDGLRLQLTLRYEKQDDAWHSGIGVPPALNEDAIERGDYLHGLQSLWMVSSLTQPLPQLHPALTTTLGWMLRDAETTLNPQSLLARRDPLGARGGLLSQLQGSVAWDTRDREPDTTQGTWIEASVRGAHPSFLSDWSFIGFNLTYRHYITILDSPRLVYAHRLGFDEQRGAPPYFQRSIMGGTQWTELGGNSVLRSYKFGRFRPSRAMYWSQELRARVLRFEVRKRPVEVIATPLLDLGYFQGEDEVNAEGDALTGRSDSEWLWGSAGFGLRLIYDEGIVIRGDVMWAYERFALPGGQVETRPQFGMFIMTGHSF